MQYNGIELKEFTSDKPVVFNPPRKMLVWDHLSSQDSKERIVYAYVPRLPMPAVICDDYTWAHCAEIPEKLKPSRVTNVELARWLAQGNGVCRYCLGSKVQSYAEYYDDRANYKCNSSLRVREWDDTDWHEPTADYLGLDRWVDKARGTNTL